VIFIDDRSTDGSFELVMQLFGSEARLRVSRNSDNIGAAASRNAGIDMAKGEYLVFLDNDTEVEPDWLDELIKVLESEQSIGATQSKILDYNHRDRFDHAGVFLIPYVGWAIPRGGGEVDDGSYDYVEDICALSASLAVKREVLNRVGLFDSKLAIFTEDVDFSWRVWLGGYRVVLAPKSVIYHWNKPMMMRRRMLVSKTNFNFHFSKNSLRMVIKNYDLRNLLRYLPWTISIIFFRSILALIKKGDYFVLIGSLKGILWNVLNSHDSLKERHKIQRQIRRVPDNYIMQRIMVKETPFLVYRKHFFHTRQP
jgi:hypothetical protein